MKRYILILLSILLSLNLMAQAPDSFQYQAVLRDSDGNIRANESLELGITILQTTASGTEVYSETHSTGTNDHGLINIVIGEGTTSDNLSAVDWSAGPYFVEIEVDGTVMGTTQLLSVPYALHAETVTSYTETDPIFGASLANDITSSDTTNWNNKIDSESDPNVTVYSVGDFAQGGIVFWVDETGQHGLVCAIEDIDGGSGIQWYNGTNKYTGTTGDGVYSGAMNTTLIVAAQMPDNQTGSFAARICAEYSVTVDGVDYGDWYLPSLEELDLIYGNKAIIDAVATDHGGSSFTNDYYWSSTEYDNNSAKVIYFDNSLGYSQSKHYSNRVRAIRAF